MHQNVRLSTVLGEKKGPRFDLFKAERTVETDSRKSCTTPNQRPALRIGMSETTLGQALTEAAASEPVQSGHPTQTPLAALRAARHRLRANACNSRKVAANERSHMESLRGIVQLIDGVHFLFWPKHFKTEVLRLSRGNGSDFYPIAHDPSVPRSLRTESPLPKVPPFGPPSQLASKRALLTYAARLAIMPEMACSQADQTRRRYRVNSRLSPVTSSHVLSSVPHH